MMNHKKDMKASFYKVLQGDVSVFDFLQANTIDGLWYYDVEAPENRWISDSFWKSLGYSPPEDIDQLWLEVSGTPFSQGFNLENPQVIGYNHKDSSMVWLKSSVFFVEEEGRKYALVAHSNIDKQKDKEHELNNINTRLEKLNQLLLKVGDLIFILDNKSHFKEYYSTGEDKLLLKPQEFLGKKISEVGFPKDTEEVINNAIDKAKQGEDATADYELIMQGETRHFRMSAKCIHIQEDAEIIVVVHDITEAKEREIALFENQKRLKIVTDNFANGTISLVDEQLNMVYTGGKLYDQFGLDPQDFIGTPALDHATPEVQQFVLSAKDRIFAGEEFFIKHQYPGLLLATTYSPVVNGDGSINSFVATSIDITQQEETRKNLLQKTTLLRDIADSVPGLVMRYALHADGTDEVLFVSGGAKDLYGVSPEEAMADSSILWSKIHPKDVEGMTASVADSMKNLSPWQYRFRIIKKDGTIAWVASRGNPHKQADGSIIWNSIALDITQQVEAEIALTKTKERLTQTNEVARVGAWEFLVETQEIYWSKVVYDIYDLLESNPPTIAEGIAFYKEGESRDAIIQAFQKAVSEGKHYDVEAQIVTKEGKEKWVRTMGRATMKDGVVERVYGAIYDIDAQKKAAIQLQENLDFIKNITTQAPGCLFQFSMNKSGDIKWDYLSEVASVLYGQDYYLLQRSSNPITAMMFKDDVPSYTKDLRESLKKVKSLYNEHRIKTPQGTIKWLSITANPQKINSEDTSWYGYIHDITENKIMHEELIASKMQAEHGNKAKSEFLANMSHEIRTPLNSIIGFSELMKDMGLTHVQKEYINHSQQSAKALMSLVNDILDFSKIEAEKFSLTCKAINIEDVIDEAASVVAYTAQQKELSIITDLEKTLPALVYADGDRIRQILINLLNNAVKFTEQGSVTLAAKALEADADRVNIRLSVQDTGVGIHPDNHQRIFKAFTQEDEFVKKRFGGTGLGLNISNKLLNLMGSQLQLKSQLGEGATFYFDLELPIISDELESHEEAPSIDDKILNFPPFKILVVDDNKVNRILAKKVLERIMPQCSIIEATGGHEAIEHFKQTKPDLVFMDIQMPLMDGYQATGELRSIDSQQTPIIALTAGAVKGERGRCLDAGMNDYLSKPIDIDRMKEALVRWLEPLIQQA